MVLDFPVEPLVWNATAKIRCRRVSSTAKVVAKTAACTLAETRPYFRLGTPLTDRNTAMSTAVMPASSHSQTHVSRRQYAAAPSGSTPCSVRSAMARHTGFRPGRSENPKRTMNSAESMPSVSR